MRSKVPPSEKLSLPFLLFLAIFSNWCEAQNFWFALSEAAMQIKIICPKKHVERIGLY